MEVYIDDILVKSLDEKEHITHLEECFARLNAHNMKMNPAKCRFAVASGELLGFLFTHRGIEANLKQINALIDMVFPRTKRKVQRLTGRVAMLNQFISRSTDKCLPFYNTERKQEALMVRRMRKCLFLYIVVSATAVSKVLIREEHGEQKPIFYISKTLFDAETR